MLYDCMTDVNYYRSYFQLTQGTRQEGVDNGVDCRSALFATFCRLVTLY